MYKHMYMTFIRGGTRTNVKGHPRDANRTLHATTRLSREGGRALLEPIAHE